MFVDIGGGSFEVVVVCRLEEEVAVRVRRSAEKFLI
jgi:exopolyphosphatase/pppGpp-phosphohydrolase